VVFEAPGRAQQQASRQPELKAHAPSLGCLRVQTPAVQNSTEEHSESWPHGVPGHMPPNSWTSPALHSHAPPLAAQSCCKAHVLPPADPMQQHGALEWQSELSPHGHSKPPPDDMVVVVEVLAVVVVVLAQPVVVHASQQLRRPPTHARPPFGALHALALVFTEHLVVPFALVLQHVTLLGLPQVDLAAHLTTAPLHA
jgi:hypothetical protein